jgi:short-subunit dehydrogenase
MTAQKRGAGQTALVTGASGGIGLDLAECFAKDGYDLVLTARSEATLKQEAERLAREHGVGAVPIASDLGVHGSGRRLADEIAARGLGVDVLVNNAGYAYRADIGSLDLPSMREMFDVNVFGLVDITNRVVPLMKEQGEGDIINVSSTSGMKGGAGGTAYGGSKWAVRGISQCWQAELRPLGIRVVSLCPSEVQTNFGGKTGRNNPNKLYADDIAATIMAALDMPRRALWPELAVFANNPWKED